MSSPPAPSPSIALVVLALWGAQGVWAQANPPQPPALDAAAVAKATEGLLKPKRKPMPRPPASEDLAVRSVPLLAGVQVQGDLLKAEIAAYWADKLQQPVPNSAMVAFKDWVYQKIDALGYLGYLNLSTTPSAAGDLLHIEVVPIRVGKITVDAHEEGVDKRYLDAIARRFSRVFPMGQVLDVLALEKQLDASAYDLPLLINIDLLPPEGGSADLHIAVKTVPQKPWSVEGASVQVNNAGLEQFGRWQALGVVRFEGWQPLSSLTLTALHAEKVDVARAEYALPLSGLGTYLRTWAEASNSNSAVGYGLSASSYATDFGLGATTRVEVNRLDTLRVGGELSRRHAWDDNAGLATTDSMDTQLHLKLALQRDLEGYDAAEVEIGVVLGDLDLGGNPSDLQSDAVNYQRQGRYQVLQTTGKFAKEFAPEWMGSLRWRAQAASKNLSTYNRIALGGMAGIRAYHAADGTGDMGAVVSLDLTRQLGQGGLYVGGLYDLGLVKTAVSPLPNTPVNRYTLQGAGLQMGGTARQFVWNLSLAKSFGDGQNTDQDPSLTPVGRWRLNLDVSRRF